MEWIKIKTEHISPAYTNYEVGLLVKYQILVAQLKRVPSDREVKMTPGLTTKRLQMLEERLQELYGIDMKTIANRVLVDVKSLEDVRQYEKNRKRKQRAEKQLSRGTDGDSPTVDKIREDKIRIEREKKPENSISYLKNIPAEDIKVFVGRFDVNESKVKDKAESLHLYCKSKGKVYKNYKAFLLTAMKKDFTLRVQRVQKKPEKKIEMTPEQKANVKRNMDAISQSMRLK